MESYTQQKLFHFKKSREFMTFSKQTNKQKLLSKEEPWKENDSKLKLWDGGRNKGQSKG